MTATIALPRRQLHSDFLARLRTVGLGLGGRGVMGLGLGRSSVQAAEASWWLAGGAPTPVAVYQPIGAASLAASYVNLVNPGTYDAVPGSAPSWSAGAGWIFNTNKYLNTFVVPQSSWTVIVRFANAEIGERCLTEAHNGRWFCGLWPRYNIAPYNDAVIVGNDTTWNTANGTGVASGVLAIAGLGNYYVDGAPVSVTLRSGAPIGATNEQPIFIGCSNRSGMPRFFFRGDIAAYALYNSTLDAAQNAALAAAMAAL